MPEISSRAAQIPASPIRKLYPLATQAQQQGKKIYHLNIGQPDIPTPSQFLGGIKEADIDVLDYSPSQGTPAARQALVSYYEHNGIQLSPEDLVVTTGGSEAVLFALFVCGDYGSELIVPEPFYANYNGFSDIAGLTIKPLTTRGESGFALPSEKEIEALISPQTAGILYTNPSNPTGKVYEPDELKLLQKVVEDHDLYLIADEVYREFVYGDVNTNSVLQLPDLSEHAIMVDSISKRFSACGARIGTLASRNRDFMNAVLKMAQARLSPPTLSQLGLATLIDSDVYQKYIEETVTRFNKRRQTLLKSLSNISGLTVYRPQGAFYVIAQLPVENAEDFVRWMLTDFEANGETVMLAPAAGFYNTEGLGRDEVRISYVLNQDDLRRSCELIADGLRQYRRDHSRTASTMRAP